MMGEGDTVEQVPNSTPFPLSGARRSTDVRMEMAKAATPYMHPRLQAMEYSGNPEAPVRVNVQSTGKEKLTHEELMAECEKFGLPTRIFQP